MNKKVAAIVGGVAGGVLLLGVGFGIGNANANGDVKELEGQVVELQHQMGDHELHEEYLNQWEADLEAREAAVEAREAG